MKTYAGGLRRTNVTRALDEEAYREMENEVRQKLSELGIEIDGKAKHGIL